MMMMGIKDSSSIAGLFFFLLASTQAAGDCELYTVHAGDTCVDIGRAANVTYAQLLSWNQEIDPLCSNLGNITEICISNPLGDYAMPTNTDDGPDVVTTTAPVQSPTAPETNSRCGKYHKIVEGDNCLTITAEFDITLENFLFLNPQVFHNCTNLWPETYYCVRPVGYITTYPGYGSTATTDPFNQTTATSVPSDGNIWDEYPSSQPVIPIANGTRLDCYWYMWLDNLTDALADCWSTAIVHGATGEEFILWNPSLAEDTASGDGPISTAGNPYAYPCTLSASVSYCVELSSPTPGEIANCTMWYAPQDYDTCEGILILFYLTIEELYRMNPSVGSDCAGMAVGTYYCISTYPGGVPAGISGGTPTATTSGAPTPTTTGGLETPTPTQSGMVDGCTDFYLVQEGDGCWAIADKKGIALEDFYAWNPAVGTDCSGLWPDVYVCVGIGG